MTAPVALVTGAARGIGAATCAALARDGFRVIALDTCAHDEVLSYPLGTEAQLAEVVESCGADAEGIVCDVRDADGLTAIVADLDRLDAVVAAAGVVWGGPPLWETPPAVWDAVFDVNVRGVFHTVRAAMPRLLEHAEPRSGRIVAVASSAWNRGLLHMGAYAASKHAVVGLVRSLAADLATSGITANAVAPGSTETDGLVASAAVYGLETPGAFAEHHTIGRLLQPGEVAEGIAWLCSPAASGVTGSVLAVDGGMGAV
ncbi:MAG: mycofactocin-coupled SDR family oxidoreductase [Microthrixaceae bacterium]